jgi:hypothetical protein
MLMIEESGETFEIAGETQFIMSGRVICVAIPALPKKKWWQFWK